ncbi:glycosyltransferase [Neorhizobium sp. CSC1952]|uniref:glycosyltransferase n=1 Tax=Neorhizobium sp. CSC1952 TaxID=2978974 RepID=UPI0025A630FB|nr:glycosyltransferase [Rhizobium sp. CSC1952]WJR67333.1 glycosyltransferase [Rhizobium sp. CSC1952]
MGVNVCVIYHHYPHYRAPILRELKINGENNYEFWGDVEEISGINPFAGDEIVEIKRLSFRRWGPVWILSGYWKVLFRNNLKVFIVLGNPNMPASWIIACVGRALGKKVLFWSHGWRKPEPPIKARIRNIYFRLCNKVLVYGKRAKSIAVAGGFPEKNVAVIYNSLDFDKSEKILKRIFMDEDNDAGRPQLFFEKRKNPVIICTARLIRSCRFDLLFEAAAEMKRRDCPINILLVGDGPERMDLEAMAKDLALDVHFFGACYNEEVLGKLIYFSDLTVSPGKIGLTVIHSLTYGTPAITHGDMDFQMPEAEAIIPNVTGAFFERGNYLDLADKIQGWLDRSTDRNFVRGACMAEIKEHWTPRNQRRLIDQAISQLYAS